MTPSNVQESVRLLELIKDLPPYRDKIPVPSIKPLYRQSVHQDATTQALSGEAKDTLSRRLSRAILTDRRLNPEASFVHTVFRDFLGSGLPLQATVAFVAPLAAAQRNLFTSADVEQLAAAQASLTSSNTEALRALLQATETKQARPLRAGISSDSINNLVHVCGRQIETQTPPDDGHSFNAPKAEALSHLLNTAELILGSWLLDPAVTQPIGNQIAAIHTGTKEEEDFKQYLTNRYACLAPEDMTPKSLREKLTFFQQQASQALSPTARDRAFHCCRILNRHPGTKEPR